MENHKRQDEIFEQTYRNMARRTSRVVLCAASGIPNERFNEGLTQALALLCESAAAKHPRDVALVNVHELTSDALHTVYWDQLVPSAVRWQREIRRVFGTNEHSGSDGSKLGVRVPLLLIQFKEFDSALMVPYIDGHVRPRQIVTILDVLHSLSDAEQRPQISDPTGAVSIYWRVLRPGDP